MDCNKIEQECFILFNKSIRHKIRHALETKKKWHVIWNYGLLKHMQQNAYQIVKMVKMLTTIFFNYKYS